MSKHLTNIVVSAVIHRDQKIFAAKRAATTTTWQGRYECVGGHLDPGESLQEGLRREVREEIGTEILIGRLLNAFTHKSAEPEHPFKVKIAYLCELEPGQEPVLNPMDHSEFRWVGEDEIDIFGDDPDELETLKIAFKILKGEK